MSVVITIIGIVAAALFVYLFVVLLRGDRDVYKRQFISVSMQYNDPRGM